LDLQPGLVRIVRRDGMYDEHTIPEKIEQSSSNIESMIGKWAQLVGSTNIEPAKSVAAAPNKDEPSAEGLDVHTQTQLLEKAAHFLRGGHAGIATALIQGLAALSWSGHLSPNYRSLLERSDGPAISAGLEFYSTKLQIRALLEEIDRLDRLEAISGPGLTMCDNRPTLDVIYGTIGPFSVPLSRLRIALLPGEADHVELYDIRIGMRQDCPIGIPMISRLPGYAPGTVREIPDHVAINGTLVRRYLPGTILAGQLRDGADPEDLSPKDLLGGVEIDLGRTFPPLSYVYLFYRVAPGHVFCAVVEPIVVAESAP